MAEKSPEKKDNGAKKTDDKKKVRLVLSKNNNKGPKAPLWVNAITALLIFFAIATAYSYIQQGNTEDNSVAISTVAQDIKAGLVTNIEVKGDDLTLTYSDESIKESKKEISTSLVETLRAYGVTEEELAPVGITINNDTGVGFWLLNLLPILLPILFIVIFFWFISRQAKGAGMQAFSFGQSKARLTMPSDKFQKVTFKDVAGAREAKEELSEIVDFLKNPKKFIEIGAQIPKGVLLMGAPGTGKTLLARAVAGEANVAYFSISGSEFVEMFVGVGASRVRDLFKLAKQTAPAIIFIDEIDAVGRVRGTGVGGGNDEREQTLNQILVEMDGFEPNEKVIIMAATNRPDVLDPALLRPGRFDRRVVIDPPDRRDREEILKIHARKKPLAEDVNLGLIAERTPGFSGADLYSLMNEGAILAARESRNKVAQFDLIRSIEKVMLGPERKSHILSTKEKEITAYHEAGHAIVASLLPFADPVHKITIISRGRAAGYTLKLPIEDRRLQSRNEFLDDIAVSLGGYVTEKMVFGDLTTGPSNDLQVSTAMARDMVTKYGMSDAIGPIALESGGGRALFGKGVEEKDYSSEVGAKIDAEVSRIMNDSLKRVEELLTKHRALLDIVSKRLVETETIEKEEYEQILIANGVELKQKNTEENK